MIGRTLGHYRIEEKLGEGGVGVVYRALDLHLDRPVAIKVLRPKAALDPRRKQRFVQEAKAASALDHPNIITVYDIDNDQGVDFIAMEYIDGRTLHQAIARRGLELTQALKYALQITSALATAHQAGIVHRDLKPANVMVKESGLVKVLDFGMAKLTEPAEPDEISVTESAHFSDLPRTEEGTVVGTAAYMSPEQAEARKVDARSDIFSFGAVFYEMITGRQAFTGEARLTILFSIVREDPKPAGEMVPGLPPEIDTVIARCLRKDPRRRFQVMEDVQIALQEVLEACEAKAPPHRARPRRRWLYGAVAAGAVGLAVLGISVRFKRPPAPARQPALTRLTADSGLAGWPALSPDGKLLVYASDRSGEGKLDLWLQQVSGGDPVRLTREPADAREPAFAPDGASIAFRAERDGGGVYLIPLLGGEPRLIARHGRRPRFSPDGKWIVYWVRDESWGPGESYVAPSGGGASRLIQPGFADTHYPIWAPDGQHLLFCGTRDSEQPGETGHDWWVTTLDGRTAVKTGAFELFQAQGLSYPAADMTSGLPNDPGDWSGDRVFFSARLGDSVNLWQVAIRPEPWRAVGPPQRVTFGATQDLHPSASAGRLVFVSGATNVDIWGASLDANRGRLSGEPQPLAQHGAAYDAQPSLSADGNKLVYITDRSGSRDVWIKDLTSGREMALTATPVPEGFPKISPDGSKVAYRVIENPKQAIYVAPSSGGAAEKACEDCGIPTDWSSDGTRLLFEPGSVIARVVLFRLGSREQAELFPQPRYGLHAARLSPDQRWVAYHGDTGPFTRQIFVAPFREGAPATEKEWIPVTDGSAMDHHPVWSPDGNLLYFLSEREGFRCIRAQRLHPVTRRPMAASFPVAHFHTARRSLLMSVRASPSHVGLSVARGRIAFSVEELSGNIWMTHH